MNDADKQLTKLCKWFDAVEPDFQDALQARQIRRAIHTILESNPSLRNSKSILFWWMYWSYVGSIVIAVRRQLKQRRDSISFQRLLIELQKAPELITRERVLNFFTANPSDSVSTTILQRKAENEWDRQMGVGIRGLSSKEVSADLDELRTATTAVEEFGDRVVAHFSKEQLNGVHSEATFDDLNRALDTIEKLMVKYGFLLRGKIYARGRMVSDLPDDWDKVFEVAWKNPEGASNAAVL